MHKINITKTIGPYPKQQSFSMLIAIMISLSFAFLTSMANTVFFDNSIYAQV